MSKDFVPQVAMGLLHHPVMDRNQKIVATNITNFDIHDIARACRVYGVQKYFLIHPTQEQLMFVERVLDHWRTGYGSKYNSKRKEALRMTTTAESLQQALAAWGAENPLVVATHARAVENAPMLSFSALREKIWDEKRPCFIVLGTGYGMTDQWMSSECNAVMESIRGAPPDDFRHLSVRSAASIILDRLLGPW